MKPTCVYGVPGGSLNTGWKGAKVTSQHGRMAAAKAERDTAALLDPATSPTGAVVLHDLRLPNGGGANIDHIFIVGNTVHLIDSKAWRPGFLWTVGGTTRRGMERTEGIDKDLSMSRDRLMAHFATRGITGICVDTTVVVWPSNSSKKLSLWAATNKTALLVHHRNLPGLVNRWVKNAQPANREVVEALIPLLITPPRPSGYVAAGLDF